MPVHHPSRRQPASAPNRRRHADPLLATPEPLGGIGRRSHEAGSTTIGFLLVFPLVLFATFGLFQFVLYALATEEISTAAREAARRAALDGSSFDDGARLADDIVTESAVLDGPITVTGQRGTEQTTITVTGRCRWLLSDDLFGDTCTIQRTATVPTEGFTPGLVPT
jgi:Flp pilus assembly protein TadG